MASVGLHEAARLSGKSRSTLHRAMTAGRLAFSVDELGQRRIDTAELDRAFGVSPPAARTDAMTHGALTESDAVKRAMENYEGTIADLRRRLDEAHEERRTVQARLDNLLAKPSPPELPPVWWRRVLLWLKRQHTG
jgi:hypothetical protein